MTLAIIGATGLVGKEIFKILEESTIKFNKIIPVASKSSIGKVINFRGSNLKVISIEEALNEIPKAAIFSAGSKVSLEWASKFSELGTFVIDNSSAWRMNSNIKLIVPEINANTLNHNDKIISNPNCSTIQLTMAIAPIHKKYGIKRMVISTYQSVTGSGYKALKQLMNERGKINNNHEKAFPHKIDLNVIPHIDDFLPNGYTKEEMKIINETKKILNDQSIKITATAVRIPVIGAHSESVNLELKSEYKIEDIKSLLVKSSGIFLEDDPQNNIYPMPISAQSKDFVYIGRLRRDDSVPNGLNIWVVSDNLRKGAATNTVQILKYISKFL